MWTHDPAHSYEMRVTVPRTNPAIDIRAARGHEAAL
jgi:hypothetical protein